MYCLFYIMFFVFCNSKKLRVNFFLACSAAEYVYSFEIFRDENRTY